MQQKFGVVDLDELAKDVERVLGELNEIPFEPLKEEQEEGMRNDILLEKQVSTLSESFINFFKGTSSIARVIP